MPLFIIYKYPKLVHTTLKTLIQKTDTALKVRFQPSSFQQSPTNRQSRPFHTLLLSSPEQWSCHTIRSPVTSSPTRPLVTREISPAQNSCVSTSKWGHRSLIDQLWYGLLPLPLSLHPTLPPPSLRCPSPFTPLPSPLSRSLQVGGYIFRSLLRPLHEFGRPILCSLSLSLFYLIISANQQHTHENPWFQTYVRTQTSTSVEVKGVVRFLNHPYKKISKSERRA